MFDKDITIVNKIYDSKTHKSTYKLSYVKGFWSSSKGVSINGVDLVPSNGFTCRILMSERGYVKPELFKGNGWTLRNDDYAIKGRVAKFDPSAPGESFKITSVAVKDYGSSSMQHFEISG